MTLKESLGFTALSLLPPFLLFGLQAGCTYPAPTASTLVPTASELQRLQGTWEGVVAGDKSDAKYTITITGNSLHFHRDPKFWFATTITLPADTDPRQLHATINDCAPGQENSVGKVVVAIFKIEDGLCPAPSLSSPRRTTQRAVNKPERDRGFPWASS